MSYPQVSVRFMDNDRSHKQLADAVNQLIRKTTYNSTAANSGAVSLPALPSGATGTTGAWLEIMLDDNTTWYLPIFSKA